VPAFPKSFVVAAVGAAALAAVAVAQPAAAEPTPQLAVYSGSYLTGTKTIIDLDSPGQCENLAEPAESARNLSSSVIDVYYRTDCVTGTPGRDNELHHVMDGLHYADFRQPALSYRVRS
jgi:hypothetical protein